MFSNPYGIFAPLFFHFILGLINAFQQGFKIVLQRTLHVYYTLDPIPIEALYFICFSKERLFTNGVLSVMSYDHLFVNCLWGNIPISIIKKYITIDKYYINYALACIPPYLYLYYNNIPAYKADPEYFY